MESDRSSCAPAEDRGTVAPLFSRSSCAEAPKCPREHTVGAVRRATRGDSDAFAFIYRHYAPRLFGYVRRIVRNDYDAQDVTQQVFVKLATSLDKYDSRRADFSTWILRLAHNAAVDHIRKHRLVALIDPVDEPCEADRHDPDDGRSLRDTFRALSSAQRDVLLLREVVGLTPREVASRLGKTEAAVNTCHHRARLAAVRSLTSMGSTPATCSHSGRRAA